MNRHSIMARFICITGICLSCLVVLGCSDEPDLEYRFENADGRIRGNIRDMSTDTRDFALYYLLPTDRHALEILHQRKWIDCPIVFSSVFASHGSRGYSPRVRVEWFDAGYSATGLLLVDAKGRRYEFSNLFAWTPEIKEEVKYSVYLTRGIFIKLDGGMPWDDQEFLKSSIWPVITLPVDIFSGEIEVGLLLEDGTETNTVKAWVGDDFLSRESHDSQAEG